MWSVYGPRLRVNLTSGVNPDESRYAVGQRDELCQLVTLLILTREHFVCFARLLEQVSRDLHVRCNIGRAIMNGAEHFPYIALLLAQHSPIERSNSKEAKIHLGPS